MILNQACRHREEIDEQVLFRTIHAGIENLFKVLGQARDWLYHGASPSADPDQIGGIFASAEQPRHKAIRHKFPLMVPGLIA